MAEAGEQLTLSWPAPDRFEAEDFMVGDANQQAWDMLERWPNWPEPVLRLSGPAGVGKTHLASIFARRTGALWLPDASLTRPRDACTFGEADAATDPARTGSSAAMGGDAVDPGADRLDLAEYDACRPIVIDSCDAGPVNEHGLFHLLNRVRAEGGAALLVSRTAPQSWGIVTPDLLSRLRLSPVAQIAQPDDALFRAILVKLFHDRQLSVDVSVLDYLARRLDRSVLGARELVARIDARSLSLGRRVSRALVADVLRDAGQAGDQAGCDDEPRDDEPGDDEAGLDEMGEGDATAGPDGPPGAG